MSFFTKSFEKDSSFNTDETIIKKIPIDHIKPDPTQVRVQFDEEKLKELSDSIKERGVLNPVHVRLVDKNSYVILTGERRYRASKIAEQKLLPCIVHDEELTESEIKAIQLVENLQRQDLSAIETAKGFQSLTSHGLGQREIARHLGISESTVSKGIKILKTFPTQWIENVEQQCKEVSIDKLYNIAKEKNKNKRTALYSKLMDSVGIEVDEEPEKQKEKSKNNAHCEFSEEDMEFIWDELKKLFETKGNLSYANILRLKNSGSYFKKTKSKQIYFMFPTMLQNEIASC